MTMIAPEIRLTPEEFEALPDAKHFELVDGKVEEREVSIESSRIGGAIFRLLANEAARTNEAVVYPNDLGYRCYPDDEGKIRRPDVSVIRTSRLEGIDGNRGFMPVPADLVVEVVSPNDLFYEVTAKVREYLAAGFPLVWVVHPILRTVTIYKTGERAAVTLEQGADITAEPALVHFTCKVGQLFE